MRVQPVDRRDARSPLEERSISAEQQRRKRPTKRDPPRKQRGLKRCQRHQSGNERYQTPSPQREADMDCHNAILGSRGDAGERSACEEAARGGSSSPGSRGAVIPVEPDDRYQPATQAEDEEEKTYDEEACTEEVGLTVVGDGHPQVAEEIAGHRVALGRGIERRATRVS